MSGDVGQWGGLWHVASRMTCDNVLKTLITNHLVRCPIEPTGAACGRTVAVAVAITGEGFGADLPALPTPETWRSRAALMLTRRSSRLRHHPGQWALPGGRVDTGETPEQTALRERCEEVGLALDEDDVLARLDDFVTRSGLMMTPVVIWADTRRELIANQQEVDSIHRIPATEFLCDDAPLVDPGADGGAPVLRMRLAETWIAALTAAILFQFREVCLRGKPVRVALYEQAHFAWR